MLTLNLNFELSSLYLALFTTARLADWKAEGQTKSKTSRKQEPSTKRQVQSSVFEMRNFLTEVGRDD